MKRFHSERDQRIVNRRLRLVHLSNYAWNRVPQPGEPLWEPVGLRKQFGLLGCGNKHCSMCSYARMEKRLNKRRLRRSERDVIHEQDDGFMEWMKPQEGL